MLAALDRVVDLLNIHDGCVRCLIWNADGSMLGKYNLDFFIIIIIVIHHNRFYARFIATAGDDNILNIWNFFGHSDFGPAKSNAKLKCVTSKLMLGNPSLLR